MERLAEWGLRLQPTERRDPQGSKIGGYPWLPHDFSWPSLGATRSLFVAQIAVDDVPWEGFGLRRGLEQRSRLLFFVFQDSTTPEVVGGRVLATPPRLALAPRHPDAASHGTIHVERSVALRPELLLPRWGHDVHEALGVGPEACEPYLRLLAALDETQYPHPPRHRLLGHPNRIVDDVLEEAAVLESLELDGELAGVARRALALRVLLTLDAEPGAGIVWPGDGVAYFCTDAERIEEGRYDRVQAFTQSRRQAGRRRHDH